MTDFFGKDRMFMHMRDESGKFIPLHPENDMPPMWIVALWIAAWGAFAIAIILFLFSL